MERQTVHKIGEGPGHTLYLLSEDQHREARIEPMSSKLWRQLSTEVVERVLLFLPVVAQTRLQLGCRAWCRLITSSRFREESTSLAIAYQRTFLWCIRDNLVFGKQVYQQHSMRVDLSFIPARFLAMDYWPGFYGSGFTGVMSRSCEGKLWLCLVNLEKRTCTELPPLSKPHDHFKEVGEVVQEPGAISRFHISALFGFRDIFYVARYSSSTREWTIFQLETRCRNYCQANLCKDGSVYVLGPKGETWVGTRSRLERFSATDGSFLAGGLLHASLGFDNCELSSIFEHTHGVFCVQIAYGNGVSCTEISSINICSIKASNNRESQVKQVSVMPSKSKWLDVGCRFYRAKLINDIILMLLDILRWNGKNGKLSATISKKTRGILLLFKLVYGKALYCLPKALNLKIVTRCVARKSKERNQDYAE